MKNKILYNYFFILFSIIPISIIVGSAASSINIIIISLSFLIYVFYLKDWKCNKCDKITCKRCREIKEKDHVCDEDTVKTIQLAIRTSKPCPKCNERIHRIYGCDQVYCPLCKIVFSYSTGRLQIGGIIHQPDAINELRKNGRLHRDIRDIPCGGVGFIFG